MNKSLIQPKTLQILLSGLLFVAVLLFFGLWYPHHLHFQEQYQLFLFDVDYVVDVLSVPGGVADLFGRFLTQFFLFSWVGAPVVALLLFCITLLVFRTARQGWFRGVCLLPAILLWVYFCDENALLGTIVAVLLAQLSDRYISAIGHHGARLTLRLVVAPLLYWALGPIAIVTVLLGLVSALRSKDKVEGLVGIVSLIVLVVMPLAAQSCVALSLERLYLSPHYYRYPLIIPYIVWVAALCVVFIPLLPDAMDKRWLSASIGLIVLGGGLYSVKMVYNSTSEEVMAYDFMTRYQQWNRIVETAHKKKPNNSLSCTALNLALGMKGQLAERMFEYNQNGLDGLLPEFVRDPVSPLATSEAFYQLGMINTCQRFVFEAQEAIPDYQKSARCYKRLAETNLICGHYDVARKYLHALSKTLLYRTWAEQTMILLGNEKAIQTHKEYGRLRSYMPDPDYMFSDRETPQMLGRQILANRTNRLAYEYTQAAFLLQRDIDSFINCLSLGSELNYTHMPNMFQQAYVLWFSRDHSAQEQVPSFITPTVVANMKQFYMQFQQKPVNAEKLQARFGNTYWYYYFVY